MRYSCKKIYSMADEHISSKFKADIQEVLNIHSKRFREGYYKDLEICFKYHFNQKMIVDLIERCHNRICQSRMFEYFNDLMKVEIENRENEYLTRESYGNLIKNLYKLILTEEEK